MAFVLIVHQVEDFVAWKAVFDGAVQIRRAAGEISFHVLTSKADGSGALTAQLVRQSADPEVIRVNLERARAKPK